MAWDLNRYTASIKNMVAQQTIWGFMKPISNQLWIFVKSLFQRSQQVGCQQNTGAQKHLPFRQCKMGSLGLPGHMLRGTKNRFQQKRNFLLESYDFISGVFSWVSFLCPVASAIDGLIIGTKAALRHHTRGRHHTHPVRYLVRHLGVFKVTGVFWFGIGFHFRFWIILLKSHIFGPEQNYGWIVHSFTSNLIGSFLRLWQTRTTPSSHHHGSPTRLWPWNPWRLRFPKAKAATNSAPRPQKLWTGKMLWNHHPLRSQSVIPFPHN